MGLGYNYSYHHAYIMYIHTCKTGVSLGNGMNMRDVVKVIIYNQWNYHLRNKKVQSKT